MASATANNASMKFASQVQAIAALPVAYERKIFDALLTRPFSSVTFLASALNLRDEKQLAATLVRLQVAQLVSSVGSTPIRYRVPDALQQFMLESTKELDAASTADSKKAQVKQEAIERRQRYHDFMQLRRANEETVLRFLVGDDGSKVGSFYTLDAIQVGTALEHKIVLGVLYANRNEAVVHQLSDDLSVVITSDDYDREVHERVWGVLAYTGVSLTSNPIASSDTTSASSLGTEIPQSVEARSMNTKHEGQRLESRNTRQNKRNEQDESVRPGAKTKKHARQHKSARANTAEE